MKLQQFSGPVMAKGLEDTAFYRYNRFTALNEVGGDPDRFGVTIAAFHHANTQRAKRWPRSIVTTSTHDTKRGEDSRARLAVLSEIPQEWAAQVETWSRILRAGRGEIGITAPPDRGDEYLFYQLLLGSWPVEGHFNGTYIDRLKAAMTKSIREAKVHSTWQSPNREYESAVLSFIDDVSNSDAFFSTFLPFAARIARLGVQNSLVQLTLKLTAPGVPDIYQGSELWDLSMVDPDNRRPVDYDHRIRLLDQCKGISLDHWQDGAIKLFMTQKLLHLKAEGSYEPVLAEGQKSDCICAFARQDVMVLTALYPARREADPDWFDTRIPIPPHLLGMNLRNILTGAAVHQEEARIAAAEAFRDLPVAVLEGDLQ
jgi:(1->4)-alpha-D-glucan 1-alpha-D-glucosylmutase